MSLLLKMCKFNRRLWSLRLPLMLSLVAGSLSMDALGMERPAEQVVQIITDAPIQWDPDLPDGTEADGWTLYEQGLIVETTVELPPAPSDQRDARRIIATLSVEPVVKVEAERLRPADPWTRLGSVTVVLPADPAEVPAVAPDAQPKKDKQQRSQVAKAPPKGLPGQRSSLLSAPSAPAKADQPDKPPRTIREVELLRFITGFGGPGVFTQDVTSLAPLLHGKTTMRVFISAYKNPAWKVTLKLTYTPEGVGCRRPVWARSLFDVTEVTAEQSKLKTVLDVPPGLDRPRIHLITSGHATDGIGGDEFISRMHVLRIDGQEVARWRPWAEDGGALRDRNPMSGRARIDGRMLWSSDLDRSGWHPGLLVEPFRMPAPELTPGRHAVELEILNIRPKDAKENYGYWRVSGVVVADEPWPDENR